MPSRSVRNHNPGNLAYGDFAKAHGAVGNDGPLAVFKTSAQGFGVMMTLLSGSTYGSLSLAEAIARYGPPPATTISPRYTPVSWPSRQALPCRPNWGN